MSPCVEYPRQPQAAVNRRLAIAILLLSPFAFALSPAHSAGWMKIKAFPRSLDQAKKINEAVIKAAAPIVVKKKPDETYADLIKRRCGYVDDELISSLSTLNPQQQASGLQATEVATYPCIFFRANAKVLVPQGATIESLSQAYSGTFGTQSLAKIQSLNPDISDLNHVHEKSEVVLPYVSKSVSFVKKENLSSEVLDELNKVVDGTGTGNGTIEEAESETLVAAEKFELSPEELDICRKSGSEWPLPTESVSRLLERYRAQLGTTYSHLSLVGVVDTGISRNSLSWLPLYVSKEEREQYPARDGDGNGYANDVYGADLTKDGYFPTSYPDFEFGEHGTEVSSIASGISLFKDRELIGSFVQLKEFGLIKKFLAQGMTSPQYTFQPNALASSLTYMVHDRVIGNQPRVLNWSLERLGEDPIVAPIMRDSLTKQRVLLVVAAGNSTRYLNEASPEVFPANLSAKVNTLEVITVAALRPDRNLASFSNYGDNIVSIAAPGCGVPAMDSTQALKILDGTSMASPIVAFVATALFSLGLDDPIGVKARILDSADTSQELMASRQVKNGKILNALAALAVGDDVIKLRDGQTLIGTIDPPLDTTYESGKVLDTSIVRVVSLSESEPFTRVHFKIEANKDIFSVVDGYLGAEEIRFLRDGGPVAEIIKLDSVREILPRVYKY